MKKRVLVIDDSMVNRRVAETKLSNAGFEVETACDGLEALKISRRNPPDLISLDLVMPKHSGAKCYRELQKDKTLSKIPVLTVTGHARDDLGKADFEEMTMSGPGVYLEKPVSTKKYVSAVRKLLGMEPLESSDAKEDDLQKTLTEALKGANADSLKRALDALKKK